MLRRELSRRRGASWIVGKVFLVRGRKLPAIYRRAGHRDVRNSRSYHATSGSPRGTRELRHTKGSTRMAVTRFGWGVGDVVKDRNKA